MSENPPFRNDAADLQALEDIEVAPAPAQPKRQANTERTAKVLIAFICTALLCLNGWLLSMAHTHEMNQITAANGNLARAVSQQVDGAISEVDHVLNALVYEIERTDLSVRTLEHLQPTLVNDVANVDHLKGLFVYDAAGSWLVSSEATPNNVHNNADREYFAYHRNNPSRETHIGPAVVSRSSGEWIIPVSRRLNDDEGNFAGVALATLDISKLKDMLGSFKVGKDGAMALTLGDSLLLRIPFNPRDLGRHIPPTPLLQKFARQRTGAVSERSPLDGVLRIINFDHTKNYPVLVTVAVGKSEALEEWRTSSYFLTGIVLALCGVILAAGAHLIRSVRSRAEAEADMRNIRDALAVANARLGHLARDDGLTGIANRRFFDMRFVKVFASSKRHQRPIGLVMIDVDNFKLFNDIYGHVAGDNCLQQIAVALQRVIGRAEDLLARYGGEEMVLLLPETDSTGASHLAERARQAVANLKIPHPGSANNFVTISLGVAAWIPSLEESATDILKAADRALYQAKALGRNQCHLHKI